MRRDLRPQSARAKLAVNKQVPLSDDPVFLITPQKECNVEIQVPKKVTIHCGQHPEQGDFSKQDKKMSSSSKLLKKFENIKAYRTVKNSLLQEEDLDVLSLKKKGKEEGIKALRKISEDFQNNKVDCLQVRPTSAYTHHLQRRNRIDRSPRSVSAQEEELPLISAEQLVLEKEGLGEKDDSRRAYWASENKFVSLFVLQKNENLNYRHQHILPIYAEVQMEGRRYVVSDQYHNCSLHHLIQEFGPFPESLAKRYLKQIGLGLQHLHFHKKSHNQLNPSTILYNKQGNLFINMIKAATGYRRKDDLSSPDALYWHSPESLSPQKSRTNKNDIWALGCLAIQMLTPHPLSRSPLHPYNRSAKSQREQTMLDNIRQRYPTQFKAGEVDEPVALSGPAMSFLEKCLQVFEEKRPDMQVLLEHQFFQRN